MWPRAPGAHAGDCKVASGLDMVRAQAFVSRDRRSSGLQLARSASLLARATLHCEENVLPFHPLNMGHQRSARVREALPCASLHQAKGLWYRSRASSDASVPAPFTDGEGVLLSAVWFHAWLPDLLMTSSDVRPTLKRHLLIFSKDDFPEGF